MSWVKGHELGGVGDGMEPLGSVRSCAHGSFGGSCSAGWVGVPQCLAGTAADRSSRSAPWQIYTQTSPDAWSIKVGSSLSSSSAQRLSPELHSPSVLTLGVHPRILQRDVSPQLGSPAGGSEATQHCSSYIQVFMSVASTSTKQSAAAAQLRAAQLNCVCKLIMAERRSYYPLVGRAGQWSPQAVRAPLGVLAPLRLVA